MSETNQRDRRSSAEERLKQLGELVRFLVLLLIVSYGVWIAMLSQTSCPNYQALAVVVSNDALFYLIMVGFYLWIYRMRGWKFLLLATLVILGFVVELIVRTRT